MASIPKMEYVPGFSLHFPKELSYGYVRFKGKVCPIGYLSLAKLNWDSQLGKLFSLPSQRNFPISFKPKVAIAKFIGKMQKKSGIMKSGLDAMPLFLLDDLLSYLKHLKIIFLLGFWQKKSRKAPPCLSLCHGVFFKHFFSYSESSRINCQRHDMPKPVWSSAAIARLL